MCTGSIADMTGDHSPWVALEYCTDLDGVEDTWVCHSPESCGCTWRSTYDLLLLLPRGCKEMGSLARVGAYGPSKLQPYASLPSQAGGSTGYFSPTTISGTATVVSTPIDGYTPDSIGPITYATPPPQQIVKINPDGNPAPSDGTALLPNLSQPPIPSTGVLAESSSFPPAALRGSTSGLPTGTGGGNNNNNGPSSTGSSSGASSTGGSSSDDNEGGGGGLTTGAKVGLGVGIAGGVCLIAAIILAAVVLRKRKQPAKGPEADPDYIQGYQDKTHDSYASTAPVAGYYDPHFRGSPSPGLYEAPQTPQEEEIAKKRLTPQGPQGPQELAGSQVHEIDSRPATPVIGSHSRQTSEV